MHKFPVSLNVLFALLFSNFKAKLARSSFFRLKTMKHPNILRYIDGVEVGLSFRFFFRQ